MTRARARQIAMACCLVGVAAGCGGSGGTTPRDASADSDADAAEGGAVGACGSPAAFVGSHAPDDPCAVDSDCHDPFLRCVDRTVLACRGADGGVDAGCLDSSPTAIPLCPSKGTVLVRVCAVRYRTPCDTDDDCGVGFGCVDGICENETQISCTASSTCPAEWQCLAPCPCGALSLPTCFPPFAVFDCPACSDAGADGAMDAPVTTDADGADAPTD